MDNTTTTYYNTTTADSEDSNEDHDHSDSVGIDTVSSDEDHSDADARLSDASYTNVESSSAATDDYQTHTHDVIIVSTTNIPALSDIDDPPLHRREEASVSGAAHTLVLDVFGAEGLYREYCFTAFITEDGTARVLVAILPQWRPGARRRLMSRPLREALRVLDVDESDDEEEAREAMGLWRRRHWTTLRSRQARLGPNWWNRMTDGQYAEQWRNIPCSLWEHASF